MAGNDLKGLEWIEITRNGSTITENGWKRLELVRICLTWVKIAVNDWIGCK